MQPIVIKTNVSGHTRGRAIMVGAALLGLAGLAGCANPPPPSIPASGITSSNGGGMRATGAIPEVGVSNGNATVGTMQRNPRVPTY